MFGQNMAIQVKKICPNSDLGYFPALAWPYFAFKGKIFKNTPVHFVDTINRSPNQNFVFDPPRKQIGLKFCRVASPENRKCLGASPENRKYLGTQKLGKGDTNEKKKLVQSAESLYVQGCLFCYTQPCIQAIIT